LGSKQIKINKRDLNKEEILNSFALAYAETMASEVFLSQSELSPKSSKMVPHPSMTLLGMTAILESTFIYLKAENGLEKSTVHRKEII
jgi:hypothetical protein